MLASLPCKVFDYGEVNANACSPNSEQVCGQGRQHRYESVLVRRTYRDGKKVRHETLANLSKLPAEVIAAIEATLKGQALVPAEAACTMTRSLPHGHVAAVAAMARRLGFPGLLGPACRSGIWYWG